MGWGGINVQLWKEDVARLSIQYHYSIILLWIACLFVIVYYYCIYSLEFYEFYCTAHAQRRIIKVWQLLLFSFDGTVVVMKINCSCSL